MRIKEPIIQFVGLKNFLVKEKADIMTLSQRYHDNIERMVDSPTSLKVTCKSYEKDGKKKKTSCHVITICAGKTFEADQADWDLRRALHKAFKNLEHEIKHAYHSDTKGKRTKDQRVGGRRFLRFLKGSGNMP